MALIDDLQSDMQSQGLVDGATNWPSVRRRELDDKGDRLVILTEDGGGTPEIKTTEGIGDSALTDPPIQVRVRGPVGDSDASKSKAQGIYDEYHGELNRTINSVTYFRIRAQTEHPLFVGFDDDGRPSHSFTLQFMTDAS